MNEAPLGLLLTILFGLILVSGFFSSSETGMMSLNRYRLKHLLKTGHSGAERAEKLLKRPDRLIGLILIGNNLVNILASAIATVVAIRLWGDAGIAIATVALTIIILIFAEITPKTIAALHPEKVAFPFSVVLLPLMTIMYPAVVFINGITNALLRLAGFNPHAGADEHVSAEELRTIVTESGQLIPKRHRGMLLNILDLEEVSVDDVMIGRNDIYGLDLSEPDEVLMRRIQNCTYTRLPVYEEDINNLQGIFHMRSLSRVLDKHGLDREALRREMDTPYFIPESIRLHTQLMHFQRKKQRLAIIVDEYGEVLGLLALEDILEEIVGEFTSNMDAPDDDIVPHSDGSYHVTGSTGIRDVNKALDWELPTDGPKSISGLILEHLESFPDGAVCIDINGYHLETISFAGNAIKTVRINNTTSK
ncbi:MAG: magnesium/cobalt efflux protein [Gammaproteobacteria bacterium]|nr:MAG: magnesium/cobalt efflux protein [Gammaproteobacteria bacterium]